MVGHHVDARQPHSVRCHSTSRANGSASKARSATARSRARKAPKGTQLSIPGLSKHGGARPGAGRKHGEHSSHGNHSSHGGARPGAGRKPGHRTRVAHRARPVHKNRYPVHITLRTLDGLVSLREPRLFAALRSAIARSQRGPAFRITDFSVEPNHGHFITEASDARCLSNGVRALVIRLTLAIRRITGYRGPIWADRYHAHELRSPREVRSALVYVLNNWKKHVRGASEMDPCSSAPWFSGWSDLAKGCFDGWASAQPGVLEPWTAQGPPVAAGPAGHLSARQADSAPLCPVVPPATWLSTKGWRTKSGLGSIKLGESPADSDGLRLPERAARSARTPLES